MYCSLHLNGTLSWTIRHSTSVLTWIFDLSLLYPYTEDSRILEVQLLSSELFEGIRTTYTRQRCTHSRTMVVKVLTAATATEVILNGSKQLTLLFLQCAVYNIQRSFTSDSKLSPFIHIVVYRNSESILHGAIYSTIMVFMQNILGHMPLLLIRAKLLNSYSLIQCSRISATVSYTHLTLPTIYSV